MSENAPLWANDHPVMVKHARGWYIRIGGGTNTLVFSAQRGMGSPVLPASEEFSSDVKDGHMKNNAELQQDVQNAIKWEPLLNAAEIGVTAKDGVITLTGTVDSYAKKLEAEKAAMNVAGVNAVAEEITVKFGSWGKKDDTEIATSAANALKWNWQVPNDKVKVQVQNGWVTLTGELQWNYEREAAHNAIRPLLGVVGVTNTITIKADAHNKVEKELVEDAIARHWSISDQDIHVNVLDSTVTLTGTVGSMYQKRKAGRVAWNTPGIYNVNNDLLVEYDYAAVAL